MAHFASPPSIKEIVTDRLQWGDPSFDALVSEWMEKASPVDIGLAFDCCKLEHYHLLKPLPIGLEGLDQFISQHWFFSMDESLVTASKEFYQAHLGAIYLVLGTYSLPFCYQSAEGAMVLYHSKRLYQDPLNRLAETAQFMSAVYQELSASNISPTLRAVLLRVRLVHSLVRSTCKKYNLDFIPINQTELIGTGLAFSLVVLRGLRKMGIPTDKKVTDGWLRIWNNISYELGVLPESLPNSQQTAWAMAETIEVQCFRPNKYAPALTQKLAIALDSNLENSYKYLVPKAMQIMKYFLGSKASLLIGIPDSINSANTLQIQIMSRIIDKEMKNQVQISV